MGVFETKVGTWAIDYRYKGRRYRKVVAPTRKLALDIERKILTDIKQGAFFPDLDTQDVTFAEIANKYWTLHGSKTRGASNFIYTYNKILERFGHMKVTDISTADVQTFYNDTWARTSPSTANRMFSLYRAILNKAITLKLYKGQNPCQGVIRQRENPPREHYFDREQIKALLINANNELKPLLAFSILTGARRGESLNLYWKDIDFNARIIRILKSKSGKGREIPISQDLMPLLLNLRKGPFEKVFNITVPALRYSFNKLLKKLGMEEYHFHDLRHTFASHYMMNGGALLDLSKLMGHSRVEQTVRYSHLSPHYIQKTISVMNGVIALPEPQNLQLEQKQ